jgi:hypothetical protein
MHARAEFITESQIPAPKRRPFPIRISSSRAAILAALVFVGTLTGCSTTQRTPEATLTAASLTFSAQLAHTSSTSQTVVLSNPGNAPLTISGIALTGPDQTAFSLTNTCGPTLPVSGQCSLSVQFTPATQGSFNAAVTVSDNAAGTAQTIALTGTGTAPQAAFASPQLTFPATDVGFPALPQSVQLTNSGTAPLQTSGLTLSGTGASAFQLSNTCAASLTPGASCTLSLLFTPPSAGTYSVVLSDPAAGTQSVLLTGTGSPDTPLSRWHNALLYCHSEPVNILVLGDSRSIVDQTVQPGVAAFLADTFGQKWADRLAATLQTTCGSHGSGLVPFLWGAQVPFLNGDYYQIQGNWTTYFGLGPQQFGGVPANMVLQAISATTIQFNMTQAFDHLNAYCESGPGLNAWTITVDGTAAGTCGGNGGSVQAVLGTSSAVALGVHTAALTCAAAPCAAYGMEAVAGTAGVSVHNLSVGSCAAECFGLNPGSELAFSDLIPGQALVIVELLTNDPGVGYSTDSYGASLGNIIQHERSLPGAPSILMYAPLQDNIGGQGPYYPVLSNVANAFNTAFFDLRATYGYGFLPQYFGPDGAHENNDGHALVYRQVISAISPTETPAP